MQQLAITKKLFPSDKQTLANTNFRFSFRAGSIPARASNLTLLVCLGLLILKGTLSQKCHSFLEQIRIKNWFPSAWIQLPVRSEHKSEDYEDREMGANEAEHEVRWVGSFEMCSTPLLNGLGSRPSPILTSFSF